MAALPNLSLGTDPNFTAMCSMFPKDRTGWRDKTVSEERRIKNSGKFLKDITEQHRQSPHKPRQRDGMTRSEPGKMIMVKKRGKGLVLGMSRSDQRVCPAEGCQLWESAWQQLGISEAWRGRGLLGGRCDTAHLWGRGCRRSWEQGPTIPQFASARITPAALGCFSHLQGASSPRQASSSPPGTHLMNQRIGHLRPEPYRGLFPRLSKLGRSSAGQGGWRQFPFFSSLSVLSGSLEPKGHMAWGNGGGGSKYDWVKKSKSQANDAKEVSKHGPTNTAKPF